MTETKIKCPCCGKSEVREYDICDICNWENDPIQLRHPDMRGGANTVSLKEAIEIYKKNGKLEEGL